MNIYIGENIKRLRNEKSITQETLAEYIGISFQAVSKWERGDAYPDITLIPAIANYFNVTIDELMGNDRIKCEEDIDRIIKESLDEGKKGHDEEACKIIKSGYKQYPYSYKMMIAYGDGLTMYTNSKEDWIKTKPEIKRIAELVLDGCTIEEYRYDALSLLSNSVWNDDFTNRDEYRKVIERFPSGIDSVREVLEEGVYHITTEKGRKLRQKNMLNFYWYLRHGMLKMINFWEEQNPPGYSVDIDTKISVSRKLAKMTEVLFDEDDYLEWNCNLSSDYWYITQYSIEKGDIPSCLDALEKCVEYCIAGQALPPYAKHTTFLFDCIEYNEAEMSAQGSCFSPEWFMHNMKQDLFNPVSEDERFKICYEKLKNCPRSTQPKYERDWEWTEHEEF